MSAAVLPVVGPREAIQAEISRLRIERVNAESVAAFLERTYDQVLVGEDDEAAVAHLTELATERRRARRAGLQLGALEARLADLNNQLKDVGAAA